MLLATRVVLLAVVFGFIFGLQTVRADQDDLEKLFAIGDEAFEPVTWPLNEPPFTHRKSIRIRPHSLTDGWVLNHQCHTQFANMPSLQIVFRPNTTRDIQITDANSVGRAWVEGATVQLENVGPDTRLCFRSENRVFSQKTNTRRYELKVGPFYYRYLDGYFPMLMELDIEYPKELLRLIDISPQNTALKITHSSERIKLTSLFQGKLWITVDFEAVPDPLSKPR